MPRSTDGSPAATALAFEDLVVGQDACLTRVVDQCAVGDRVVLEGEAWVGLAARARPGPAMRQARGGSVPSHLDDDAAGAR